MLTSSDIALLYRVSELARRFGLRPSEAEANLSWIRDGVGGGVYDLYFGDTPDAPGTDKGERFRKMMDALGCDGPRIQTESMDVMEDIVERAMSLAPRARTVG